MRNGMRTDGAVEKVTEKEMKWAAGKKKRMFCVVAGVLLGVAGFAWQHGGASICTSLEREDYGGDPVIYDLSVEGLEHGPVPVQIEISPRMYTEEEAKEVFDRVRSQLSTEILGENPSLDTVSTDLELPWEMSGGIRISWHSSEPQILESDGSVLLDRDLQAPVPVTLSAELTDGVHRDTAEFSLMVLPKVQSDQEQLVERLVRQVEQEAGQQPEAERIALPVEFAGRSLRFRKEVGNEYLLFPILGIVLAMFFHWQAKNAQIETRRKREKQLQYDYADLVYQLMVFTGAGLTISRAWKQIVDNYEKRLESGTTGPRAVYEEMEDALGEMENGRPESQAVSRFGDRCQLNEYRRLSAILGQNQHTGMKNLQELLAQEMDTAWEQQKQTARRLGEEAGTKLLVPLFLMLLVVMVLVMVPAMLAMA